MARERVFAVVGLGTFGREVCNTFMEKGGRVIAIDNNPGLIDRIKDSVTQAILIDTTDEETISKAPLEDVDVAVVAIGDNVEASILTTALLKRIGVPRIVARAVSDIHQQVLLQVGADEIVNIEIDEGRRVAQRLISPEVLDNVPISGEISISELYVPKTMLGMKLAEVDLRKRFRVNIVSIKRDVVTIDEQGNPSRSERLVFPGADDVLEEGDVLVVVGTNDDIEKVKEY
jgi:trk system potassium uptake protein TrkA